MSGLKTRLAAFALLACYGTTGEAQGVVPGGWAPQFGYQSFGGPGFGGMAFSDGTPGFAGAVGPMGQAAFSPFAQGSLPYGYGQGFAPYGQGIPRPYSPGNLYGNTAGASSTAVATDPLINAIRRSVRSSRRR